MYRCSSPQHRCGGQVAVEVVGLGSGTKGGLLVVRVIVGGGQCWRNIGPSEGIPCLDAITRCIIRVRQVPDSRDTFAYR